MRLTERVTGIQISRVPQSRLVGPATRPGGSSSRVRSAGQSFEDILQERLQAGSLRFSGHAQARLRARNIQLSPESLIKLETAVEKAAAKGGRESLIVVDGNAFVVSVKNRTVITAMDREKARESVFTQIDSAVLAD